MSSILALISAAFSTGGASNNGSVVRHAQSDPPQLCLAHEIEVPAAWRDPPRLRREWRRVWCIMTARSVRCSANVDGWGSWGFAILPNAAGRPVVSLTYETEAEARASHALMAKVIVGAAITPHS
jgi:hypothetical protein